MADQRSMVSMPSMATSGDSESRSYSQDTTITTASGNRIHSRRSRHMAKLRRRMENAPQRKLLFRPKVYEYWTEGDDEHIGENEKLFRDVAAKELKLLEKKKHMQSEATFEEEEEESELVAQLEKLKSRKQREEEFKIKMENDRRKKEEDEMHELEEKLASELQNPSVYGWYFTDGYYDNAPFFGVRQDLIPKFLEDQAMWWEEWTKKYPETFTNKFKRFFWPPNYICKRRTFRTRGSYLDFPEVIADWPTGVNVSFEREPREYISNRHDLFGIDEEQRAQDEAAEAEALAEAEEAERLQMATATEVLQEKTKMAGSGLTTITIDFTSGHYYEPDQWYYDDEDGVFYQKKLGFMVEYYYDGLNHCWRHKKKRGKYTSENQQTPYDYYFDDTKSQFVPRDDYHDIDEIVFDRRLAVYRIHMISKIPLTPSSMELHAKTNKGNKYKAPKFSGKPSTMLEYDTEGHAFLGGSKMHKPTDFYFDEEFGKWISRDQLPPHVQTSDVTWDENGMRYARKYEGVWRGLTGLSPDDYYWSDKVRKFIPKPPRQGDKFKYYSSDGVWRKTSEVTKMTTLTSEDIKLFYFDDLEGQFKPKDLSTASPSMYIQGKYSKIWRNVAKPKSNLYPEDFYWDTYKKKWLPKAVRYEMLKNAEMARQRNIIEGTQAALFSAFDIQQNDKDTTPEDFFFDFEEGIYLKKRKKEDYAFDTTNGVWTLNSMKDRPPQRRFPHEYYFDPSSGDFYLKEQTQTYEYDQEFHIWKKGNEDLTNHKNKIDNWYFDEGHEEWVKKGHGIGDSGVRFDEVLMIHTKPKTGRIYPDNYFFHDVEGRFLRKEDEDVMAHKYVYDPTSGAWRNKDIKGTNKTGLTPRHFFYDDTAQVFKLKIRDREKMDYFFDNKNKIYRHVTSSGRTKSGFRPSDFVWNSDFKTYVPVAALKKGRADISDTQLRWEPIRDYSKPWIVEAPLRNPDSSKMEEKKDAQTKEKTGKSMFNWLKSKSKNKVEPTKSGESAKGKVEKTKSGESAKSKVEKTKSGEAQTPDDDSQMPKRKSWVEKF